MSGRRGLVNEAPGFFKQGRRPRSDGERKAARLEEGDGLVLPVGAQHEQQVVDCPREDEERLRDEAQPAGAAQVVVVDHQGAAQREVGRLNRTDRTEEQAISSRTR